jgi:hypothetical protein
LDEYVADIFRFYPKMEAVSSNKTLIPPTELHGVVSRETFKSYMLIIINQKVHLNLGTTRTYPS